ncbi:CDP-alcohol phosphatidyltransferase family protein [Segetibacter sp. 3557_3]|uniref:CDP-alcohol phosphatidyltransferase family protein n=1 Tax=Segetibacter sp. 3557_3 TaxID=2547429 RepID=UPI001058B699|nr:CDP-alcohol phosphatidyltransferase family protein [Segetibacter sp. 3557_3]TDH26162.1 CDP-alcohol phosphatidyltransferase family protein [Segetibacter sp. 3557_3]
MKQLPFALILFRLSLTPVVLIIAHYFPEHKYLIGILCFLAILSDIMDGIIARNLGVATSTLRLWDSNVDLVFWLATCVSVGICFPGLISENRYYIIPLFVLEPIPDIIYYTRFRKFGCAHNYASKLFGLAMLASFSCLFFAGIASWPFYAAIIIGIVSQLDRVLISAILPSRVCDVPSCYHAWLIKKEIPFKKHKLFHS